MKDPPTRTNLLAPHGRTIHWVILLAMSALALKAKAQTSAMSASCRNRTARCSQEQVLFDHSIGARQYGGRNIKAERFGGL